jgi:hypothetical protein
MLIARYNYLFPFTCLSNTIFFCGDGFINNNFWVEKIENKILPAHFQSIKTDFSSVEKLQTLP